MFRSIRWTFLFWYGLLFLILLGAFGAAAYVRLRRSAFHAVDARLDAKLQVLAEAIDEMSDGTVELSLPRSARRLFAANGPYYGIWKADGSVLGRSPEAPVGERPGSPGKRLRGSFRELVRPGPGGTLLLVGMRLTNELTELHEFLALLLTAGAVISVLGLLGGWWLMGRVLGPISRISRTASAISASTLSERIDVAKTESELSDLARVLNETLGRLESAWKTQVRFTADASHELRTPLSVVQSTAEGALRKDRTAPEYREALGTIQASAARMKSLVEGLLTLARADGQAAGFRKERVELAALVEDVGAELGTLARDRQVELSVSAAPSRVEGDADRLREAVTNIATNAIRCTPPAGKVELRVRTEAAEVLLEVADTGIGIREEDAPHVFERFFRSDAARSRDSGGAGLGLAITRWIVEGHGGRITFTSRVGSGTTFVVRLPASKE